MKISEQFIDGEGDTFHVKRTFDPNPTLQSVADLRSVGADSMGDSKHVGRVPGWLLAEWLKEAGVRWDDIAARDDVIRKKMLSGEFSALRNWGGSY